MLGWRRQGGGCGGRKFYRTIRLQPATPTGLDLDPMAVVSDLSARARANGLKFVKAEIPSLWPLIC